MRYQCSGQCSTFVVSFISALPQASLTTTMSMAFIIPYDKFDAINDVAQPMYIWLPVVLVNLLLVFYGCWVFLPQVVYSLGLRKIAEFCPEEPKNKLVLDIFAANIVQFLLEYYFDLFFEENNNTSLGVFPRSTRC